MAKDGATIALGIIYCVLIGLCWVLLFCPTYIYHPSFQEGIYIHTIGGIFALIGNLVLIPSFILYMVFFCSTEGSTSASVGFGLGIPGWALGIFGQILQLLWASEYFHFSNKPITILLLSFYIALVVIGSILLARRHKWEELGVNQPIYDRAPTMDFSISSSPTAPGPPCSICSGSTRFIAQYNRYYCDTCQKYV